MDLYSSFWLSKSFGRTTPWNLSNTVILLISKLEIFNKCVTARFSSEDCFQCWRLLTLMVGTVVVCCYSEMNRDFWSYLILFINYLKQKQGCKQQYSNSNIFESKMVTLEFGKTIRSRIKKTYLEDQFG